MEKAIETKAEPKALELTSTDKQALITRMFDVGAHYGYSKARRHPSTKNFVFGVKNKSEIFDLEKTSESLFAVKNYVRELASQGKQILFVSSKLEVENIIKDGADSVGQPYAIGRWIGGTLTNNDIIKKRVKKLVDLREKTERGELGKYTKKEQLLISRDIDSLEKKFGGIVSLKGYPAAVFVIDPKKESIAVAEAKTKRIPVIALASNDCNIKDIEHPLPGNDAAVKSVEFFVSEIVQAYKEGKPKNIK